MITSKQPITGHGVVVDWKSMIATAMRKLPPRGRGEGVAMHPLMRLLKSEDPANQELAREVVEKCVRAAEGRMGIVADLLHVSWMTALRLVQRTNCDELAGQLRFYHAHPGPTGFGIRSGAQLRKMRELREKNERAEAEAMAKRLARRKTA